MSAADAIVTIAHWQVHPEAVASVLALVDELRRHSLEEPGCLGYEALQSVGGPDSIVLIERYADPAALAAHRNSAHYKGLLVEQILPLLSARGVELLRPFDASR
jgi:quinol monooxygenase YgiN